MSCVLCNAINESFRIVYKDDLVVVIVNLEPLKHGHVMVMPVRHAENLSDLHPNEATAFLKALDQCMDAITHLSIDPPICLINGWKHRTQPHLHAHALPSKNDSRKLFVAAEGVPERNRANQETLTAMANEIRQFFNT